MRREENKVVVESGKVKEVVFLMKEKTVSMVVLHCIFSLVLHLPSLLFHIASCSVTMTITMIHSHPRDSETTQLPENVCQGNVCRRAPNSLPTSETLMPLQSQRWWNESNSIK